ncbi:pinin/SDK/memA/ protein conserved region-domain-containing protein [Truncatella angustata]|uniref:Pinin/SDK/memA/ protein conserved region-domain-containing protein n=1 Tax=Truncatella angustata TaxID=152316 RepID=A0A9P8UZ17_9PEZI|nr:pinin/SDK/memA/ protein conserved region-domain-containing protein [Truncatella angustata]KAH6661196.1 pinin/SDK/memA/ protein conserved region-domain-containing protein [Truncatella angustata]
MATDDTLVQDAPAQQITSKPDESDSKASPNPQKRKASSPAPHHGNDDSQSPKRQRRESEATRNGAARSPPAPAAPLDRRQGATVEEKKRGKRLFGGLLNTLSRTNDSSSQRRRSEIERKQQAKVSQQKAEDDKHREARLAKLKAARQRDQIEWEEQVMRTKHGHLLDTARFLQTRSEPRIYYLPWDLTEDQEDLIKDQVHDAEDLTERETREFKQRKDQRLTALGISVKPIAEPDTAPQIPPSHGEHVSEDVEKTPGKVDADALPSDPSQPQNTTESTNGNDSEHTSKAGQHQDKDADEAGDVMVEGDEDTVIY